MRRAITPALLLTLILLHIRLAEAQQATKVPRIGFLGAAAAAANSARTEAFRRGLRELGYMEGKSIVIEWRWAEGRLDRLPEFATELVRLKSDVIVTMSTPAAFAARNATDTIPIVAVQVPDPVAAKLVGSLAHPGKNITGLTNVSTDLAAKRLELLRETLPNVKRVAYIWDPNSPGLRLIVKEILPAAQALGLRVQLLEVRNPSEVQSAFDSAAEQRVGAAIIPSFMATSYLSQIINSAVRKRLPLIHDNREFVEQAGGLMSYGPSTPDMFRRAAYFVDKIIKGAKPTDLPFEQPMKFELIINLKTAKQIGLTIPPNVLARADKVIK
jgi:putative ABC transport system substrate-binding protein